MGSGSSTQGQNNRQTQGQTQQPVAPIPAITTYVPNPASRYEIIAQTTYTESVQAAVIWDSMVRPYSLSYAFGGSFAARLRGGISNVPILEIVVDPAVLANNRETLTKVLQENPDRVAITGINQQIILLGGNRGVSFECYALGTHGYPGSFVSPYNLPVAGEPEFTFYHKMVDTVDRQGGWWLPIIQSRMLLQQRLSRFDSGDPRAEKQNVQDFDDIKTFLRCAKYDNNWSFPTDVADALFFTVIEWIKYAETRGMGTDRKDLEAWRHLGLAVPDEYLSRLYRRRQQR